LVGSEDFLGNLGLEANCIGASKSESYDIFPLNPKVFAHWEPAIEFATAYLFDKNCPRFLNRAIGPVS